jgi:hypothetical protein
MAGKREPERFVDLDQISRPKIEKAASPDEGLDGAMIWRDSWERGAQTPISELFAGSTVMGSDVLNCGVWTEWTRRMISLVDEMD